MKKLFTLTILCLVAMFSINAQTTEENGTWLKYDNGVYQSSLCLTFDGETSEPFEWGVMFPASDLAAYTGQVISKVSLYDSEAFDGEVFIYINGTSEPESMIHRQTFSCPGSNDFYEIELDVEIVINGNENIWVVMTHYGAWQPASHCGDQGDPNGRWLYSELYQGYFSDSGWLDNSMMAPPGCTWMIRAYVTEPQNEEGEGEEDDENTNDTLSIADKHIEEIMMYPNPTEGNLNIKAEDMRHISITNSLGQVIYDNDVNSDNKVINMSQYNAGVYIIRIETENGVAARRITVTR